MNLNRLNDTERRLWVLNDEGLYFWWKRSRRGLYAFVRGNRAELDRIILAALNKEPAR